MLTPEEATKLAFMPPEEAQNMKDRLGCEREDSMFPGGRRARLFQQSVERKSDAAPKEECALPPVGRHTEALEHPLNPYHAQASVTAPAGPHGLDTATASSTPHGNNATDPQDPKLSKRSGAVALPDLKKPKLHNDQEMKIEPGASIESQETDVDIPPPQQADSPSFASQARDIPERRVLTIDMTQNDDDDDVETHHEAPDELEEARCPLPNPSPNLHAAGPNLHAAGIGSPAQFDAIPAGAFPVLITNDAAFNSKPPPPPQVNYSAPQDMPPWLQDIHQGLQSLHTKADRQFSVFSTELQKQHIRVSNLETAVSEHSTKHTSNEGKISMLEKKIRQLEESIEQQRSRSPARTNQQVGSRSPRSPRSPRLGFRQDDFVEEDLDLVFGGWTDARRDDAIEEARNILKDVDALQLAEEIWTPYSRTNFVKVRLIFPDPEAHISRRRKFQTELLDKLKKKSYVSGVPGSEKCRLWMTKSKTPEERARIRAIVLTKEFYKGLPHVDASLPPPFNDNNIDISWNGKVFLGRHQLLGSIHREGEPQANDVMLSDSKGNHLEWYLIARTFAAATARPAETLQDCWDRFGSSGQGNRD